MKVSADFLRADIMFVMISVSTDHHYMPQHKFEDSRKMLIMDLPPDYYRIIIFTQNVEMAHNVIFQPMLFSFNFRLFSFIERDKTFIHPVHIDSGGELSLGDEIQHAMPFSTPEKLECYSSGRRLPNKLTQDILLHETDFSFTFSIVGEDLAFINQHVITY